MKTKVADLLAKKNPLKKEKETADVINLLMKKVDDSKFSYFTEHGYKGLSKFINDSLVVWDSGTFLNAKEEVFYKNMLNCANFEQFYGYYNLEAEPYQMENFEDSQKVEDKKEIIKKKILDDLNNYIQLDDYFIFKIYQQMEIINNNQQDLVFLDLAVKNIIKEWFNSEHLNGIFLLADIVESKDLLKKVMALLDYINVGENKTALNITVSDLYRLMQDLLNDLAVQKKKLLGHQEKIKIGKELFYKKPKNPTIILDYVNENCVFTPANFDRIYKKAPSIELKLLQLFLHEYATYIFTSARRDGLDIEFTSWFDFYQQVILDDEIKSLINILHQNREKISELVSASESYADLFGVYYYNYFRNGEDTFYKLNQDKSFMPELMKYLGQVQLTNS